MIIIMFRPDLGSQCLISSMDEMLFQFPVYDHTKHSILNRCWMEEGLLLHFISSMAAGFAAAVAANPSDIVKTRIMNQKPSGEYQLLSLVQNQI